MKEVWKAKTVAELVVGDQVINPGNQASETVTVKVPLGRNWFSLETTGFTRDLVGGIETYLTLELSEHPCESASWCEHQPHTYQAQQRHWSGGGTRLVRCPGKTEESGQQ